MAIVTLILLGLGPSPEPATSRCPKSNVNWITEDATENVKRCQRCQKLSQDGTSCHKISQDGKRCHNMSQDVEKSKGVTGCHKMPQDVTRCHQMSQGCQNYQQMTQRYKKIHKMTDIK